MNNFIKYIYLCMFYQIYDKNNDYLNRRKISRMAREMELKHIGAYFPLQLNVFLRRYGQGMNTRRIGHIIDRYVKGG